MSALLTPPGPDWDIDWTDLFAGGGGSSSGLTQVRGNQVRMAANHWRLAVDTHQHNHPWADHDCADISQVDPARYPRTRALWASPDCTFHTKSSGRKRAITWSDGKTLPTDPAERSRATMWDVVRFAEFHDYEAIVVENVIEVMKWLPFRAWVMAMTSLGYTVQFVYLNSAHTSVGGPAATTSRDRFYAVFTKIGAPLPDVAKWTNPSGVCACGVSGQLVKSWKKGNDLAGGVYKRQYVFRCASCDQEVAPTILGANTVMDWSKQGRGLFDRSVPLVENTIRKISEGLVMHSVEGMAVPFIVSLRGGGSHSRSIFQPLDTITAQGNHHGLLVPPGWNPVTGLGSVPVDQVDLAACRYRVAVPSELKAGTAFTDEYRLLGNGDQQRMMVGNAVTPPAARVLGSAVYEALTGKPARTEYTSAA